MQKKTGNEKLAFRVKHEREKLGLNQAQLGDLIGIGQKQISYIETAYRSTKQENLLKLCRIFNCDLDYLLGKSDYKTRYEEQLDKLDFIQEKRNSNEKFLINFLKDFYNWVLIAQIGFIRDSNNSPNTRKPWIYTFFEKNEDIPENMIFQSQYLVFDNGQKKYLINELEFLKLSTSICNYLCTAVKELYSHPLATVGWEKYSFDSLVIDNPNQILDLFFD